MKVLSQHIPFHWFTFNEKKPSCGETFLYLKSELESIIKDERFEYYKSTLLLDHRISKVRFQIQKFQKWLLTTILQLFNMIMMYNFLQCINLSNEFH